MAKGIAVVLVAVGLLAVAFGNGVRAADQAFVLYGADMTGWGTSPDGETIPGPTMTVTNGDVVTMYLFSDDGLPHVWYIDYNGNHVSDNGEPESAPFSTDTVYTFTADTTGSFTYYCEFHPVTMYGTWITNPGADVHDVAVTGVSTDKTVVTQGEFVNVTVTVTNQGNVADTTTVTPYAGATALGNQTVTLTAGQTTSLLFPWNTAPFAPGIYTISAQASVVPGETDTADNQMTDGTVTVNEPPPPPPPPPGNLIADLAGKSAWPAHHHFPISRFGFTQTLFGKVANIGPGPVNAKVVFTIRNAFGTVVAVVESNAIVIPFGQNGVVLASWTVMLGLHYVTAQAWFDTNDDDTFDGSSPGTKNFKFNVVP